MTASSLNVDAATPPTSAQGLSIVGFGGLVLSVDVPLIRLSESGFWTVLLIRGLLTFLVAVAVWWVDGKVTQRRRKLIAGRSGLVVTALYALAATTFIVAVFHTSAANVVFILAFNPMFAAILSWLIAGEKPSTATLLAIPATLAGVFLIIGAGLTTGHWYGDIAALATAFLIALAITIARRSRTDMRYASALGAVVPAVFAIPFVAGEGLQSDAIVWLVLDGGLVLPLATICLALGPMLVPAPAVSMAYLLETVLAPLWIWLIFGERPLDLALAGGAIVVVTLLAHSAAELTRIRRSAAPPLRRPFTHG
ncbi:DMT family transporter [Aurantimonas sp. VKM B-3413]|uniref:DMT family transporter n=1 Tax=Aurantimonas sp. VKM B-3413 TaxID=2779401 RepID=UPI001E505B36|nr:DMT family transporter [Aurantimonas sp. VKM B-3413]MCB8837522.1 DMT family transporter [Aurantimonas sp. VKM B-3413]